MGELKKWFQLIFFYFLNCEWLKERIRKIKVVKISGVKVFFFILKINPCWFFLLKFKGNSSTFPWPSLLFEGFIYVSFFFSTVKLAHVDFLKVEKNKIFIFHHKEPRCGTNHEVSHEQSLLWWEYSCYE